MARKYDKDITVNSQGTFHPNGPDAGIPYGGDLQNVPESDRPIRNPDPINAWQGGRTYDADAEREAHFRPEGGPSLGARTPDRMHIHATAPQLGKGRPEREGPDYGKAGMEEPEEASFWIKLSLHPDAVPKRTEWILRNVVPTALRSFVRHNLQYRDADESLGLQGQFAEMSHILAKLKRQIWDRRNPESVAVGEIQEQLESLIGHALLALDHLDKGNKDGK